LKVNSTEMHPEARRRLLQSRKALAVEWRLKYRETALGESSEVVWSHLAKEWLSLWGGGRC